VALHDITITNCYIHGWTTSASNDGAHGGVIFYNSSDLTIVIDSCEIENTDGGENNGVCVRDVGTIRRSFIHDNSSAILFTLDCNSNHIKNVAYIANTFDGVYHENGCYLDPQALGTNWSAIRNSWFENCANGANSAYLNGRRANTWCYNNLFTGVSSAQQPIEIDPYDYGSGGTSGNYYLMNNTDGTTTSAVLINVVSRGGSPQPALVFGANNLVIGTGKSVSGGGPEASLVIISNLVQTSAAAAAAGATLATLYAPTNGPAIGGGTNLSVYFTSDMNSVSRAQSRGWDIGAYEYVSGTVSTRMFVSLINPYLVSPNSYSFGSSPTNVMITSTLLTVQNVGAGILTGTSSVATPFSIISGTTYSLGQNQSQAITVCFKPTAVSNYSRTITFSVAGGVGTNLTLSGAGTAPTIPASPQTPTLTPGP
jgi:hypothetical protein